MKINKYYFTAYRGVYRYLFSRQMFVPPFSPQSAVLARWHFFLELRLETSCVARKTGESACAAVVGPRGRVFHPLLPPPRRVVLARFFGGFWPPVPCRAGRIASCCRRWEVPRGPYPAAQCPLYSTVPSTYSRASKVAKKCRFWVYFFCVWRDSGARGRIGLRLPS